MVDTFFSPKMLPLAKESLSFSNITVNKDKLNNKIGHEHKMFVVPKNDYTHFDHVMIKKMENVYKQVN